MTAKNEEKFFYSGSKDKSVILDLVKELSIDRDEVKFVSEVYYINVEIDKYQKVKEMIKDRYITLSNKTESENVNQ